MEPGSAPWRVLGSTPEAAAQSTPDEPAPESPAPGGPATWIIGLGIAAAVGIVGLVLLTASGPIVGAPDDGSTVVVTADGADRGQGGPSVGGAAILVDVGGAVRRPGLIELPPGSRLADAIEAAGGYGPAVDVARVAELNLAATLADGDKVLVPSRAGGGDQGPDGGTGSGTDGMGGSTGAGGAVDLNRATAEELDALPGIGPVTTQKILTARAERPFRTLEELVERKVIGRATLDKLAGLVVVR